MAPQEFGVRVHLHEGVEGEHVHRCAQVPQVRLAVPLEQFEHLLVVFVRLTHVGFQQPLDVAGHPDHTIEVICPEAHPHQILAFGRGLGFRTVHRLEVREHAVDHRDALGGLRDPRVGVLRGGLRRGCGGLRLPRAQRPELRVVGHQLAQSRCAGAGQPEDDHRTVDDLVGDLRVLLVGVDDLEPLDQRVADGGVLDDVAHVVEVGFVVQPVDGAFETLAVVARAEVVQAGGRARAVFEVVCGEAHR